MDPAILASGVVTALAPHLPALLNLAKAGVTEFAKTVGESAAKISVDEAQTLWKKVVGKPEDQKIQSAAKAVTDTPDDDDMRFLLIRRVAARLQNDPALAQEITVLLGGQTRVQEIHASNGSHIKDAVQNMNGSGSQSITADDQSSVSNAHQTMQ
jgi:hypothetical protein